MPPKVVKKGTKAAGKKGATAAAKGASTEATTNKEATMSGIDENASKQEEEMMENLDVQYNPVIVNEMLTDLEVEIESRCAQIKKEADFMAISLRQTFNMELFKLPSDVQKMSLTRFRDEFGESVEAVTKSALSGNTTKGGFAVPLPRSVNSSSSSARGSIYSTATKSQRPPSHRVFQTPSQPTRGAVGANHNSIIPETPSNARMPKEGETILSANGSPLGEFQTVVKPKKTGAAFIPPTPGQGVLVPLNNGEVVDLESVDVSSLSSDVKQDALAKMQAMMSNMQALMTKLGGGGGKLAV